MKKTFLLPLALAVLAFLVLPLPGLSAPLSTRIQQKREQIEQHKAREGVLSTTIQRFTARIDAVQGDIAATERQLLRVQGSLDRQKARLLEVRNRLEAARDRLERLRSQLATARHVLAKRLVEIYKADSPDALTVILEADGFGDLLEQAEFLKRISDQDRAITDRVRGLRDKAHDQAVQLAELEEQEQVTAERILRERDQVAAVENRLVGARDQLASARADKRGALADVRSSRVALEGDLAALEKEQARVQAALQGAGQTFDGPIKQGSGALIWPVNGAACTRASTSRCRRARRSTRQARVAWC
jgi:peptidoglycan hydrolase CwlO-like protein